MERARCGPYELVAQREGSMSVAADGTVRLFAEHSYLVRIDGDAERNVLRGALSILRGGGEGEMRFGNFVGRANLGGRRLDIRSTRLDAGAAERMLDEVSGWFASLPFAATSPADAAYATRRERTPRVLYHSFALLRDAFRRLGPHDLRGALERILAGPHESLALDEPKLVPVGSASRIDPETLVGIPSAPELLREVEPNSRLAATPAVRRMRGMLPDLVRVRPFLHTTDNPENRFVAGAIDAMVDLLLRFERLAREQNAPGMAVNATEATEIADFLRRCRRHRVLDELHATAEIPLNSAALRSKPGYRELLTVHGDLQARMHATNPHDAERLLESRDAASIYEYWCYIRVVKTLEAILGSPVKRDRYETGNFAAELRWGYAVTWPEVVALYNATFSRPDAAGHRPGFTSYSLPMRPDIALRTSDGQLNVFDAKLKHRFLGTTEAEDEGSGTADGDSFKPEDLHKMHAYRDALQAESTWVLFPGTKDAPHRFPAPQEPDEAEPSRFRGVGAIALRPGASHDGGLQAALASIV